MVAVKRWLLGVVLTAFAASLVRQLAPKGRQSALVGLAGGLLLALALLRPLVQVDWSGIALPAGSFAAQSQETALAYQKKQLEELSAIIAERTEAYIWDKAAVPGGDYCFTVSVSAGESGVPLPCSVTIAGPYSQELSQWLERELGLDAAAQNWLEEGEWNTRTENKGG